MKDTILLLLSIIILMLSIVLLATRTHKKEHYGSLIKQSGIDGAVYTDPVGMDGAVVY